MSATYSLTTVAEAAFHCGGEPMPEQERFQRTIDKTQLGGLPASNLVAAEFWPGNGGACAGCGDAITRHETLYSVDMRGVLRLHFHEECYVAWSTYTRK